MAVLPLLAGPLLRPYACPTSSTIHTASPLSQKSELPLYAPSATGFSCTHTHTSPLSGLPVRLSCVFRVRSTHGRRAWLLPAHGHSSVDCSRCTRGGRCHIQKQLLPRPLPAFSHSACTSLGSKSRSIEGRSGVKKLRMIPSIAVRDALTV